MAIRKEKYVDVTTKLGGSPVASRRSMTGRVFTSSTALGYGKIAEFHNADDVMAHFGASSKEYQFAVRYFGHVSKSATKPSKISFAGWGKPSLQKQRKYKVSIESAKLNGGGVIVTSETGEETRYDTVSDCLEYLGTGIDIDITLNTDIVYVSANTVRDEELMASLRKATGMAEFTQIPKPKYADGSDVADDLDEDTVRNLKVSKYINALKVFKGQNVRFDLNGHVFGGDTCCFANYGTLTILDSIGNGRAFTTNFNRYLYRNNDAGGIDAESKPHLSMQRNYATCEVVSNHGNLEILGGWYGTARCFLGEALNETTWGNAIACHANSVTVVNGGYFTTVTQCTQSEKVAWDIGEDTILPKYKYQTSQWPFCSIIRGYRNAQLAINGGVFWGLFNDIAEFYDESNDGMIPPFGVFEVNGGEFVGGFTTGKFFPEVVTGYSETVYSRNSFFQNIPQNSAANQFPSEAVPVGGNIIVVNGGKFTERTSPYTEGGDKGMWYVPGEPQYECLHFSGRVYVKAADCDFTYGNEFRDPQYTKPYEAITFKSFEDVMDDSTISETPVEALARVDALNDDFGSFCFIERLTPEEEREVAKWNATRNFKYLFSIPVTPENCQAVLSAVRDRSGVVYTLDKFDAYAEYMAMAMFAATKYDRANATKLFMYQQFDGEEPSVTTSQEADLYDSFDVDGLGTCFPVNYYGMTNQAGSRICFFQDGYNADGTDTADYCNEVWLKDAISVELLNTFIAVEKMPPNNEGEAMCKQAIASVVAEAIENGTVEAHKELDQVQKTYIDLETSEESAWNEVQNAGYWLKVAIKSRTLKGNRVQHYADYVLLYSKGDAVRKVEGRDILI